LIINLETNRIDYLSETVEGKKHDKALLDSAKLQFPEDSTLIGDLGYQGYEPQGAEMILPYKKPRGAELSDGEKSANTEVSRIRVFVEHVISSVKRLRIVKETLRNFDRTLRDKFMEIACSLHNFRNQCRHLDLKTDGALAPIQL
jgi:hypothetical protein